MTEGEEKSKEQLLKDVKGGESSIKIEEKDEETEPSVNMFNKWEELEPKEKIAIIGMIIGIILMLI